MFILLDLLKLKQKKTLDSHNMGPIIPLFVIFQEATIIVILIKFALST